MTNSEPKPGDPVAPPASAIVAADGLLALVDPILDKFNVSENARLRKRRQALMVTAMAEALRVASHSMLHIRDADELQWLADALLITVDDELTERRGEKLHNVVGLATVAVLFTALSGLAVGNGQGDLSGLFGLVAVICGVVACIGAVDWWRNWKRDRRAINDR